VLGRAPALAMESGEVDHAWRVAVCCSLLVPCSRLGVVSGGAVSGLVQPAQRIHGTGMPGDGGPLVGMPGLDVIPGNAASEILTVACREPALRWRSLLPVAVGRGRRWRLDTETRKIALAQCIEAEPGFLSDCRPDSHLHAAEHVNRLDARPDDLFGQHLGIW